MNKKTILLSIAMLLSLMSCGSNNGPTSFDQFSKAIKDNVGNVDIPKFSGDIIDIKENNKFGHVSAKSKSQNYTLKDVEEYAEKFASWEKVSEGFKPGVEKFVTTINDNEKISIVFYAYNKDAGLVSDERATGQINIRVENQAKDFVWPQDLNNKFPELSKYIPTIELEDYQINEKEGITYFALTSEDIPLSVYTDYKAKFEEYNRMYEEEWLDVSKDYHTPYSDMFAYQHSYMSNGQKHYAEVLVFMDNVYNHDGYINLVLLVEDPHYYEFPGNEIMELYFGSECKLPTFEAKYYNAEEWYSYIYLFANVESDPTEEYKTKLIEEGWYVYGNIAYSHDLKVNVELQYVEKDSSFNIIMSEAYIDTKMPSSIYYILTMFDCQDELPEFPIEGDDMVLYKETFEPSILSNVLYIFTHNAKALNKYSVALNNKGWSVTIYDLEQQQYQAVSPDGGAIILYKYNEAADRLEIQLYRNIEEDWPTIRIARAVEYLVPGSKTVIPVYDNAVDFEVHNYLSDVDRTYNMWFTATRDSIGDYAYKLIGLNWDVDYNNTNKTIKAFSPDGDIQVLVEYDYQYRQVGMEISRPPLIFNEWPEEFVADIVKDIAGPNTKTVMPELSGADSYQVEYYEDGECYIYAYCDNPADLSTKWSGSFADMSDDHGTPTWHVIEGTDYYGYPLYRASSIYEDLGVFFAPYDEGEENPYVLIWIRNPWPVAQLAEAFTKLGVTNFKLPVLIDGVMSCEVEDNTNKGEVSVIVYGGFDLLSAYIDKLDNVGFKNVVQNPISGEYIITSPIPDYGKYVITLKYDGRLVITFKVNK